MSAVSAALDLRVRRPERQIPESDYAKLTNEAAAIRYCCEHSGLQDKLAGFKSPKGARRVGYASYAKRLREMVAEDRQVERNKAVRELSKLVEQRLTATWSDGRPVHDRAKPLRIQTLLSEVSRMPGSPAGLRITRKAIAEAVAEINRHGHGSPWQLPAQRAPKPRSTPAARDRAMRGVRR